MHDTMHDIISSYLRPSQVTQILNVSGTWVDRLVQLGRLHPMRTPLGRLFDPQEVEALRLERQERQEREIPA